MNEQAEQESTSGSYDDISLAELKSFSGEDNYPRKWLDYLQGHTPLAGFNGWAVLYGLAWFVYRRLYVQGFIAIAIEVAVPLMIGFIAVGLFDVSDGAIQKAVLPLAFVVVRLFIGYWANIALCGKAVQVIREVDQLNLDNESHLQAIAGHGRVNIGGFLVAFGVVGVIDRIILFGS